MPYLKRVCQQDEFFTPKALHKLAQGITLGQIRFILTAGYFLSRLRRDVEQKGRRVVDPAPWLIVYYCSSRIPTELRRVTGW
jgi:hypothetical protein